MRLPFLFFLAAAASARLQQHHTRSIINLCIGLKADLVVDVLALLGLRADLCLCLHDLDLFLDTDVRAIALVGTLGRTAARAHLETLFYEHGKPCDTLPAHAHRPRFCGGDPCAIECDVGFQLRDGRCVCPYPTTECNGKCDYYPKGCASAAAIHRTRREIDSPITSLKQAQATCKRGEIVCGVPGSSTAFECLDVSNQLDSCGGCVVNHPWSSPASPAGRDCNDLVRRHALEVSCQAGRCIVHSCQAGFRPNDKADDCVSTSPISQHEHDREITIPNLIKTNLQSVVNVRTAVVGVASSSDHDAHVAGLVDITAQIGLVALHAVHRPNLAKDIIQLVSELDSRTSAAMQASRITSAGLLALNELDASIDILLTSLLDLSAILGECQCHDDQNLLEAINMRVVGDNSFNEIAFQLSRRQYPPIDRPPLVKDAIDSSDDIETLAATRQYPPNDLPNTINGHRGPVSHPVHLTRRQYPPGNPMAVKERDLDQGLSSATTIDLVSAIDLSDPTIAASLRSYAALLGLAYNLRSDSYSLASSSQQGSLSDRSADIVRLSEAIIVDLSSQPLCLESASDSSKDLLAVTESCLGLTDLGMEKQSLLTSIYGLSLQLWVSSEKVLDDLDQCGCENHEDFISGTATILASLKADLTWATPSNSQSDSTLDISASDDITISAILNYTQTVLDLRGTLALHVQSLSYSCDCLSSSSPLSDCVVTVNNLTAAISDPTLDDISNVYSLPPLLYQLDSLLGSCLWLDGTANETTVGFGHLLQTNYDLLVATENLLDLLDSCGCKENKKLVAGAKKLAGNRKDRRMLASR